jgi:hypothetical protein
MVMAQDDCVDSAQVYSEFLGILEHRIRTRPGVEQYHMTVGLYERCVSPLAYAAKLGQHGGERSDLHLRHDCWFLTGCRGRDEERNDDHQSQCIVLHPMPLCYDVYPIGLVYPPQVMRGRPTQPPYFSPIVKAPKLLGKCNNP